MSALPDATNTFPIRVGSMLFTMIEAHAGHEVAYNRWYERDHFYGGCLIGEWNFAGGRFIATADCKDRRFPADSPVTDGDVRQGTFLSVYWIAADHHWDWAVWAGKTLHQLHEDGRMFPERDHVHTKLYDFDWAVGRDDDGVPVDLALDRRFPGMAVLIGEAADDVAAVDAWLKDDCLPRVLPGSGAAIAARWSIKPMPSDAPGVPTEEGSDRQFLLMLFLDGDPTATFDAVAPAIADDLAASGLGTVTFASPFLGTVPGTDTHLDAI